MFPNHISQMSAGNDDDFEVVPQNSDTDTEMWDATEENEDEVKQKHIQSKLSRSILCLDLT